MNHSQNWLFHGGNVALVLGTIAGLTAFGCGPDSNGSSSSASSSSSSSSSSTSSSSSSSSGTAGSGGGTACLDPATYADVLSIKDSGFCVVASYTTNDMNGSVTWGRHGGLLFATDVKNGMIGITRLTAPLATSGELSTQISIIDIGLPNGSFLGAQAIDLPFFNWTAVSYTNVDPMTTGEVVLLDGATVGPRYPVNGFFSGAAVGPKDALGRLVYSGLSALNNSTGQTSALYAADACGAVGNKPRLIPDGDATCKDSFVLEAFGDASGPVAADGDGNVFAIMSKFGGDQDVRGYAAGLVARGTGPATGVPLFKVPGYAGSFAVVTPENGGSATGVVVFQPIDATSFDYLDPIAQRFSVKGDVMSPQGVPGVFMTAATAGTALNFTTDDQGRLWIAVKKADAMYAVLVAERKI